MGPLGAPSAAVTAKVAATPATATTAHLPLRITCSLSPVVASCDRWRASLASPGVCGGDAAVDVQDVAGGLGRARACEPGDRLGHVLRLHVDPEPRAAPVVRRQVVLVDAIGGRPLGLPVGR